MLKPIPGRIMGRVLIKTVKAKNRMRLPFPGWAISEEQLNHADAVGVTRVNLKVDTGESLWADMSRIFAEGRRIQHRGFEPQLLVPLSVWQMEVPGQEEMFREDEDA